MSDRPTLTLRDLRRDSVTRAVRVELVARYSGGPPVVLVARTTHDGLILTDLQSLNPAHDHLARSPEVIEAVADRVREEMARVAYLRRAA
jgi:hypothetical protein